MAQAANDATAKPGVEESSPPPRPPARRYHDLPVPSWFRPASADAFRAMEMRETDVILSSLVKGGTTWVYKILSCLLYEFDDEGRPRVSTEGGAVGGGAQRYPDGIPVDRDELARAMRGEEGVQPYNPKISRGEHCLQDLLDQPDPRLLSTHLFGERFLPTQLLAGKGRLVVVLRNLKDVLASLHFFFGEPKDGWYGNEHGAGSFARFVDVDTPNAFGSAFKWVKETDGVVTKLSSHGTVLVVYFEELKRDLPTELDRINDFLGLPPLTAAKRTAVAEACGFESMRSSSERSESHLRKGAVGDWRNYLDDKSWSEFDKVFDRILGDVAIAQPLCEYQ